MQEGDRHLKGLTCSTQTAGPSGVWRIHCHILCLRSSRSTLVSGLFVVTYLVLSLLKFIAVLIPNKCNLGDLHHLQIDGIRIGLRGVDHGGGPVPCTLSHTKSLPSAFGFLGGVDKELLFCSIDLKLGAESNGIPGVLPHRRLGGLQTSWRSGPEVLAECLSELEASFKLPFGLIVKKPGTSSHLGIKSPNRLWRHYCQCLPQDHNLIGLSIIHIVQHVEDYSDGKL